MTIEIFQTDVADHGQASELATMLKDHFPGSRINFDLEDCDRILRVEGTDFSAEKVMVLVRGRGITCNQLH